MAGRYSEREQGAAIVEAARDWIGTPYRHQASCKGVGADCLGLIRGLWRELRGPEPVRAPAYTADWSEASGEEILLAGVARYLTPVSVNDARPGSILVFRMIDFGPAKHLAILSEGTRDRGKIIHAYSGHRVCESSLGRGWARRIVAAAVFPDC